MHLTQDPHVETTHKTRYHKKPSSGAVRRRYGTARWFAARRTPLSRLTRRTRSRLESSTKPVRDIHTYDNTPSAHSFTCIYKVWCHFQRDNASSAPVGGAKGLGVLHHFPIFRPFSHFHENPSSSVISGTFSRENRFPQKRQKRPKIAKHTKHEPLPKRDAIFATFP